MQERCHPVHWNCDQCHNPNAPSSRKSMRCDHCDFDICDRCWPQGPSPAVPSGVALASTAPTTMLVTCLKGHFMKQCRHGVDWKCDVCSRLHRANSLQSLRCEVCDFDRCESCWPPTSSAAPQPELPDINKICAKGHTMALARHQVSWRCDICAKIHAAGSKRSLRCETCDFDRCEDCWQVNPNPTSTTTAAATPAPVKPAWKPSVHAQPYIPPGQSSPSLPCPKGHITQCCLHPVEWGCDLCGTHHKPRSKRSLRCELCDWDRCEDCWNKPLTPNAPSAPAINPPQIPPAQPPATAQVHVQPTAPLIPSPNKTDVVQQSQFQMAPPPPPDKKPARSRALFIGINYTNTSAELRGCINDVGTMMALLQKLRFDISDRRVLVDDPHFHGRTGNPDKATILDSLAWLVHGARPGDNLFLHYSGHGSQIRDQDGDEEDGFDETLVPVDYIHAGQIRDDDIFDIVCSKLPAGVRLTAVMDCCHSGTLMDLEYIWVPDPQSAKPVPKPRRRRNRDVLSRGFEVVSKKHSEADIVLFSGCKDTQTSADVSNTANFHHSFGQPGSAGGACTNALAEIVTTELAAKGSPDMNYVELLQKMQENLRRRSFSQIPQLSTSKPIDLSNTFSLYGGL